MSVILHIETSTNVCSVALSKDGVCMAEKVNMDGPSHARVLSVYVQEMLDKAKAESMKINAVSVSCGPGSYTGLRIGVSTVKGLCYGLEVPLIAIETLKIMASCIKEIHNIEDDTLLCPMIDARRMEVYTSFFDKDLNKIRKTSADVVDGESYKDLLNEHKILFFGNGADKCKKVLTSNNAEFIENIYPTAKAMIKLAEEAYVQKDFKDVAYFEPFYLKDFVATVSKKNVLK